MLVASSHSYWSGLIGKEIQVVSSFCIGDNQGKIMVKNIGTNPFRTSEITVINPLTGEDLTQDVSWAPSVSDPGLVLELMFEEGSGTIAKDTSGKGNDGTLYGDPQWVDGRVGGALSFDGRGDYVDGLGNLEGNSSGVSFATWIYFKGDADDFSHILGSYDSLNWGFWVRGSVNLGLGGGTDGQTAIRDAGSIILNAWSHVVATWHPVDGFEVFINGQSVKTASTTVSSFTWPNRVIGVQRVAGITGQFNGSIDDVHIYSRVLSGDEIKALTGDLLLQPGETATLTHKCSGRCRYNLVLGGMAKEAMLGC